jgi:hypothetical protein
MKELKTRSRISLEASSTEPVSSVKDSRRGDELLESEEEVGRGKVSKVFGIYKTGAGALGVPGAEKADTESGVAGNEEMDWEGGGWGADRRARRAASDG